jgi:hypothetical protein
MSKGKQFMALKLTEGHNADKKPHSSTYQPRRIFVVKLGIIKELCALVEQTQIPVEML